MWVIIGILVIGVFAPKSPKVESSTTSTPEAVEAEPSTPTAVTLPNGELVSASDFRRKCRELIRAQLTLPHTAKFLGPFQSSFAQAQPVMANRNIFTQRFETDSQNLFGATIRIRWWCTLDGHDGRYTLSHNQ